MAAATSTTAPVNPPVVSPSFFRSLLPGKTLVVMTLAGLLGGICSFYALEYAVPIFVERNAKLFQIDARLFEEVSLEMTQDAAALRRFARETAVRDHRFAMLSMTVIGVIMSVFLGAAAGLLHRSWKHVVAGVLVGVLAGGALGYEGGKLGHQAIRLSRNWDITTPLSKISPTFASATPIVQGLFGQTVAWGIAAVGMAIAAGVSSGCHRKAISRGILLGLSAVLGAILFEILLLTLVPMETTPMVAPPSRDGRMTWTITFGLVMGLMVGAAPPIFGEKPAIAPAPSPQPTPAV